MHDDDKDLLNAAKHVFDACASFSMADRLRILQLAWTILAGQARKAALVVPGGFSVEQVRQLEELEKVARLVREDTPDLDFERLMHEGDAAGALAYLRKAMDDLEKGGA